MDSGMVSCTHLNGRYLNLRRRRYSHVICAADLVRPSDLWLNATYVLVLFRLS